MAGHLRNDPVRIRKLRPEVTPALEAVVIKAMRRYPEHRYQSAGALLGDLARLDTLDPAAFDLSPEPPMGGMAAVESERRLWTYTLLIAVGFIAIVALVLTLTVVLR